MAASPKMSGTARILLFWWIIILVFGIFGNLYIASIAFRAGNLAPRFVFGALGLACVVLLYRTWIYRNNFRN